MNHCVFFARVLHVAKVAQLVEHIIRNDGVAGSIPAFGSMRSRQENTNSGAWESEYQQPRFLTLGTEPVSAVRDVMRWLRRDRKLDVSDFCVLDLGCGNGKNLKYAIENFCKRGIGYDISETAIDQAHHLKGDLNIHYEVRSIAETFPIGNHAVDVAFDVTASNSLSSAQRAKFLSEVLRVLKPGGYFFVRALCKDGDANAKNLIRQFPGDEPDTYVLGQTGIVERVFSKEDFTETYGKNFEMLHIEKTSGYQRWGNQSYKRNYWVGYFKKS